MRRIFASLVVLAALAVAGWIGGEAWAARKAAQLIAQDPRLEADATRPLREPQRIGVRIEAPRLAESGGGEASADWLDVWMRPGSPMTLRAALPAGAAAVRDGRRLALAGDGGTWSATLSPTHRLALSQLQLNLAGLTLDGAPLAGPTLITARLSGYGHDAPRGTGAAYAVQGQAGGLDLGTATGGALSGEGSVAGEGLVWLSAVAFSGSDAMEGHQLPPRLVGLRLNGVDLRLDDLTARLYGRVVRGADGLAEGKLLVDTKDAQGFLSRAADAGMIPRSAVPLAGTVLAGLASGETGGGASAAGAAGAADDASAAHVSPLSEGWPAPPEDQLRLTITFRDGRSFLGPMPIGPAPAF